MQVGFEVARIPSVKGVPKGPIEIFKPMPASQLKSHGLPTQQIARR